MMVLLAFRAILAILLTGLIAASAAVAIAQPLGGETLVLRGATVFTSPRQPPITDAVLVIRGGRIEAVGPSTMRVPTGRTIDVTGLFVTAGFQNSHVHFTEPKWDNAAQQGAEQLNRQLRDMLTRYGFTTVVDAASFLENTAALRDRVERGDVQGPRIVTAGAGLYPRNGIPYYLREEMDSASLARLRAPATVQEAVRFASHNFAAGADALKLFTASWISPQQTIAMDPAVAAAAAAEAHRRGRLVLVHPSNTSGLEIALAARADILLHAVEDRRGWHPDLLRRMVASGMAMVPTLSLFERNGSFGSILDQVGAFHRLGGRIMFGTDIGFRTDYDPTREYLLMAAAGLSPMDILASLTTVPAERFGEQRRRGRVARGMDADLVVLSADPRNSVLAFSRVRITIRAGRVIYDSETPQP